MPDGSQSKTCTWTGVSGEQYKYWIHEIGSSFKGEAGNYIFAKLNSAGRWEAVYIGETGNLSERFDNHHAMPCIKRNQATHIHAHLTPGGRNIRLAEESDLRENYDPPCNKQ